jgi:hypothetical protein
LGQPGTLAEAFCLIQRSSPPPTRHGLLVCRLGHRVSDWVAPLTFPPLLASVTCYLLVTVIHDWEEKEMEEMEGMEEARDVVVVWMRDKRQRVKGVF